MDLSLTRTGMAEHAYPPSTRRVMAETRKDAYWANPANNGTRTVATEMVRYKILKDGTRVLCDQFAKPISRYADAAMERAERKRRLAMIVAGQAAEIDTWASHS